MIRYTIGVCLVTLLLACKDESSLVYERKQVTGNAVLTDAFNESLTVAANGATIYLAQNDKADPYLYSVTADDKGKFVLYGLPKEQSNALLVGKYKNSAGITFVGSMPLGSFTATAGTELPLTPQYPGGALKFQLTNPVANNSPVAGAEVFLFSTPNQTLAAADTEPKGVVQKGFSNARGFVFFHSLQAIPYYAVAKTIIGGKPILSTPVSATVSSTTLVTDARTVAATPITLLSPTPVTKASIELTLKDNADRPVAGFTAYLFINPQQAETVYNDDGPKGFVQTSDAVTNTNGQTKFSNVDPGTYYVAVSGAYGQNVKYKKAMGADDAIRVPDSGTATIPKSYTIN